MEKKKIKKNNNIELESDIEVDVGFEAYREMLQRQREFCEKHGLRTATYTPLNTQKND